MTLPTRKLGRNGPEVPALGLGLMGLSTAYTQVKSDAERFAFLDYAYESGARFWDSSDMYGDNEDLIGQWFKKTGKRDQIFLATKFAFVMKDGVLSTSNEPAYIHQACKTSLSRLGIDTIDLYYCHRLTGDVPVEIVVGEMAKLKQEGKIRYIGLSEVSAETLRRASKVAHIDAIQMEYSPFALDIETAGILKAAREVGTTIVAYSPLGRGFLGGTLTSRDQLGPEDFRRMLPRYSEENFGKNLDLVKTITELGTKKGATPGQLTLAWLLAQGPDIIPIPGTTKTANLKENLGALEIKLTEEEVKEVRKVVDAAEVIGGRYPEGMNMGLLSDTIPLNEYKKSS